MKKKKRIFEEKLKLETIKDHLISFKFGHISFNFPLSSLATNDKLQESFAAKPKQFALLHALNLLELRVDFKLNFNDPNITVSYDDEAKKWPAIDLGNIIAVDDDEFTLRKYTAFGVPVILADGALSKKEVEEENFKLKKTQPNARTHQTIVRPQNSAKLYGDLEKSFSLKDKELLEKKGTQFALLQRKRTLEEKYKIKLPNKFSGGDLPTCLVPLLEQSKKVINDEFSVNAINQAQHAILTTMKDILLPPSKENLRIYTITYLYDLLKSDERFKYLRLKTPNVIAQLFSKPWEDESTETWSKLVEMMQLSILNRSDFRVNESLISQRLDAMLNGNVEPSQQQLDVLRNDFITLKDEINELRSTELMHYDVNTKKQSNILPIAVDMRIKSLTDYCQKVIEQLKTPKSFSDYKKIKNNTSNTKKKVFD